MAKWSKRTAGGPQEQASQQIPPLRRREEDPLQREAGEKAQILAERFFPRIGQADLSDIAGEPNPEQRVDIPYTITKEQVEETIQKLPNGKVAGPDNVPYEILKEIAPEISEGLAQAFTERLASGSLPKVFRDTTTVVLRKDKKKDYSLPGSYRLIALENSLAKVLEKIIANRIVQAAEENEMLSWN